LPVHEALVDHSFLEGASERFGDGRPVFERTLPSSKGDRRGIAVTRLWDARVGHTSVTNPSGRAGEGPHRHGSFQGRFETRETVVSDRLGIFESVLEGDENPRPSDLLLTAGNFQGRPKV